MMASKFESDNEVLYSISIKFSLPGGSGSGSGSGAGDPSTPIEDIIENVVNFFAGLPLPVVAGIAGGAGLILLIMIILLTIASIAVL